MFDEKTINTLRKKQALVEELSLQPRIEQTEENSGCSKYRFTIISYHFPKLKSRQTVKWCYDVNYDEKGLREYLSLVSNGKKWVV